MKFVVSRTAWPLRARLIVGPANHSSWARLSRTIRPARWLGTVCHDIRTGLTLTAWAELDGSDNSHILAQSIWDVWLVEGSSRLVYVTTLILFVRADVSRTVTMCVRCECTWRTSQENSIKDTRSPLMATPLFLTLTLLLSHLTVRVPFRSNFNCLGANCIAIYAS